MFKTMLAVVFAAATALPASAALAAPPAGCVLDQVSAVRPLKEEQHIGKFARERIVGATLYIPAQPNLTTDWLKRLTDDHRAHMAMGHGMKADDCVFGVADSRVEVSSNNSGFLMVTVRSDNQDNAKEILRRAELMVK